MACCPRRRPRRFLLQLSPVRKKRWVVYAKPPFAGPEAVLAYLSRYTRRVVILNSRLLRVDEAGVTLRYKDYRRDGAERQQVMTLAADEVIRRFCCMFCQEASTASATTLRPDRHSTLRFHANEITVEYDLSAAPGIPIIDRPAHPIARPKNRFSHKAPPAARGFLLWRKSYTCPCPISFTKGASVPRRRPARSKPDRLNFAAAGPERHQICTRCSGGR